MIDSPRLVLAGADPGHRRGEGAAEEDDVLEADRGRLRLVVGQDHLVEISVEVDDLEVAVGVVHEAHRLEEDDLIETEIIEDSEIGAHPGRDMVHLMTCTVEDTEMIQEGGLLLILIAMDLQVVAEGHHPLGAENDAVAMKALQESHS